MRADKHKSRVMWPNSPFGRQSFGNGVGYSLFEIVRQEGEARVRAARMAVVFEADVDSHFDPRQAGLVYRAFAWLIMDWGQIDQLVRVLIKCLSLRMAELAVFRRDGVRFEDLQPVIWCHELAEVTLPDKLARIWYRQMTTRLIGRETHQLVRLLHDVSRVGGKTPDEFLSAITSELDGRGERELEVFGGELNEALRCLQPRMSARGKMTIETFYVGHPRLRRAQATNNLGRILEAAAVRRGRFVQASSH